MKRCISKSSSVGSVNPAYLRTTRCAWPAAVANGHSWLPACSLACMPAHVALCVATCSKDVQGILSDAAAAVEKLMPLPEIEELRNLIDATITGTLDILQVPPDHTTCAVCVMV